MSDRFWVDQQNGRFTLLDEKTGWVWKGMRRYASVLALMNKLKPLEFSDEEYKRIRRLDGEEWEREVAD